MLAMLIAAALAQPNVLAVLDETEAYGNRVELLERPAGITTAAFIDRLLDEADSGGAEWQLMDRQAMVEGSMVRMIAARAPGRGLILYVPLGEDGRAVCRVVKVRPVRTPQAERRRTDRFCVRGLSGRD